MTLDEVEMSLPQGFHDAFLRAMSVDYVGRTAEIELEVWVGGMDTETDEQREAYRRVRLQFSGLLLLTVDVPDQEYLTPRTNGLRVDLSPADYEFPKHGWPDEPLPEGAFLRSFYFTNECNSYLHIAALDVNWMWLSEPRTIY